MRPNILFVTADQWRGDTLGCAGHPRVRTPHVDALAASGTLFQRHFAQATPCSPARASLYTGLYQMTTRVVRNGTPLDDRHDNIARMARRAGYDPTLFGYTDQAVDPRTVEGDDPWLTTYEGVLPGFTPRLRLPEHNGPWLSWLAARGHEVPPDHWDIYLPAAGASPKPTTAPARYGEDETETAFVTGEARRPSSPEKRCGGYPSSPTDGHGSPMSPIFGRIRRSWCRSRSTACTTRPIPFPSPARRRRRWTLRSIPSSPIGTPSPGGGGTS
jgi:arylsulfatase A-like enzyme